MKRSLCAGLAVVAGPAASVRGDVLVQYRFDGGKLAPTWVNPALFGATPMGSVGNVDTGNLPGNPDFAYGGTWWPPQCQTERYFYFNVIPWGDQAALWKVDNVELRGNFVPAPEPSTLVLLGVAGLGLLACRWRRRR